MTLTRKEWGQGRAISCGNFPKEFNVDTWMLRLASELPGLWLAGKLSVLSSQEPDCYLGRKIEGQSGTLLLPVKSI